MTAWPYMPGVPAAGHVTSRGFWHPGRAGGCVKCEPAPRSYPVLYAPSHELIGNASTERGAIGCAARIQRLPCERMTARLAERLGDNDRPAGLAWFVGPQLVQDRRRR